MAETYFVRFEDNTRYGPAGIDQIAQWAREGRLRRPCTLVASDGSEPPIPAASHPVLAPILRAPPTVPGAVPLPEGNVIIPASNPPALLGYYAAVFSLVPVFGLVLGPGAVALGIVGWRRYRREPRVKGAAHAWVAIILGSLTSLANWAAAALLIVATLNY